MANALGLDAVSGMDERQAQALTQAGVDTVGKLAAMDPDATAKRTGLSADDLRRFKTEALAMVERAARARPMRRSMTLAWIMLALIVLTAIAILYAIRVRAGAQALVAEQRQQLADATAYIASLAVDPVKTAASEVGRGNWGGAQDALGRVGQELNVLERVAPREMRDKVGEARSALGRAQTAVGARDEAASQRIDEIQKALGELAGASPT